MRILQITPQFYPEIGGLSDYSRILAETISSQAGVICDILAFRKATFQRGGNPVHLRIREIFQHDNWSQVLSEMIPQYDAVILNFVGYGYQKRGIPLSLISGLEKAKQRFPSKKLLTIFHETYALGRPWTSSFWLSFLQRSIAVRLNRISDVVVTTTCRYRNILSKFPGNRSGEIHVSAAFSNIGESPVEVCDQKREPILVIFGGDGWIRRWIPRYALEINQTCQVLNIERIVVIGCSGHDTRSLNVPVVFLGVCEDSVVRHWMLQAQVGFMDYDITAVLGKSGIFASFIANGVPVVFPRDPNSLEDGLKPGVHFLIANNLGEVPISTIAHHAWKWYENHSTTHTASLFVELLN